MFFVLSKLFWALAAPTQLLAVLVIAAAFCLLLRWMRAARWLGVAAALVLLVTGVLPLGLPMLRSLENQYPRPTAPAHVDGILILGSGFDTAILRARGAPASNGGAWRLVEGFAVARRYPAARVVFSGGSGALYGAAYSEAQTAQYVLSETGLEPARLVLEARSRDTYENIAFSKALVKPAPGQTWLLVTSAVHMPRAMAIAQKLGWPMLPWPSDYITGPHSHGGMFNIDGNLAQLDYALHEWVGLLAYRLAGKAT